MDFDVFRIATSTAQTNFSANTTTTTYTIPVSQVTLDAASGRSSSARYMSFLPAPDVTGSRVFLNLGTSSALTVSVTNGIMLTPNEPRNLNVAGFTYMALISVGVATVVNAVPIEV